MYLFIDTETNDLAAKYAKKYDVNAWPHIVQVAYLKTDAEGNILKQHKALVRPEGFTIAPGAYETHKIDLEYAKEYGESIRDVMYNIHHELPDTTLMICHNVTFDENVIGAEFVRAGIKNNLATIPKFCTMRSTAVVCKIKDPKRNSYKWPSLQELHNHLFGCEFDGAHDALGDISATYKCFFELKKRGLIRVPT